MMNSLEARERLPLAERERANATSLRNTIGMLVAKYEQQLAELPRPRDYSAHCMADDLTTTIHQLRGDGIRRSDGIAFPELAALVEQPGIARIEARLLELDAEIASIHATLARWPTADTRHPYRYAGAAFKHSHAGRYLESGEVAMLTEGQARSFSDRFTPVAAKEAVTAQG